MVRRSAYYLAVAALLLAVTASAAGAIVSAIVRISVPPAVGIPVGNVTPALADGPVGDEPQIRPGVANTGGASEPPSMDPPGVAATDTSSDTPEDQGPPG